MTPMTDRIVAILTDKLDLDAPIAADAPFSDLEIDSLALLELSVLLEQEYGVRLSEEDILEANSAERVTGLMESARTVA